MNTTPSPYLPSWALCYFERFRDRFDDPEEMPHRRAAFYRLLCAEKNNRGMRKMWEHVDRRMPQATRVYLEPSESRPYPVTNLDLEAEAFIGALIYSTDDALEDEPRPVYPLSPDAADARLRDPAQRLAPKLARLFRELRIVTPPRCAARSAPALQVISTVDRLVIGYRFDLAPDDVNEIYRRHGIEFTSDSKRGWLQRRRASDAVRCRVIEAARRLAEIGRPQDAGWLAALADDLLRLPDYRTEHAHQPELRSNKCGWPDWLRVAHRDLHGVGEQENCLRIVDWAALVRVLFDDVDVSEVRIGQVLQESA